MPQSRKQIIAYAKAAERSVITSQEQIRNVVLASEGLNPQYEVMVPMLLEAGDTYLKMLKEAKQLL